MKPARAGLTGLVCGLVAVWSGSDQRQHGAAAGARGGGEGQV